ncbi:substrate-binding domain-containing protein [Mesotoga sp. H07.pep.5.3]|uniref:substrate-binding domain-containing protein n=2 Tax=Mesotoga TaxID=1184396 RepID=UPI0002C9F41C|nr:substrate-binding domain-containing protein [Mesotoga sp. H07.pep.5.3]PIJ61416.1 transcriptional regulator [Mesotoga sp. H07.pep.5.3]CCU84928.1 Transcriptional regulator, LacI family [Mesotoga infera]
MATTLDDIAKETGLSRATVARAIGKYGYVSKKAREKVIAAAKKLNYKPNYIAKSMATGETKNIGLIVGDIQNPFFSTIARAISDVIVPEGYSLIVTSTDEKVEVEKTSIDRFFQKQVDGLILAPVSRSNSDHLKDLVKSEIPIVLIDRIIEGLDVDMIVSDDLGGGFEAAQYLLELGHRRIGFLSDTLDISTNYDRIAGYREALSKYGIEEKQSWVKLGGFTIEGAYKSGVSLLGQNKDITAVIATNNYMAAGLLLAAKDMGIEIPQDLSVISFDDIVWFDLCNPPITSVAQDTREIGSIAAKRILMNMRGQRYEKGLIRLPTRLIIRESCTSPKD